MLSKRALAAAIAALGFGGAALAQTPDVRQEDRAAERQQDRMLDRQEDRAEEARHAVPRNADLRPERMARAEREAERPERAEHADRPERVERAERPERVERVERPDRSGRH